MPDVVRLVHAGIACGLSTHHVIAAESTGHEEVLVRLWEYSGDSSPLDDARTLFVQTAGGPRAIRATRVALTAIERTQIHALPALLRELVPLPHVVGLAEIDDQLIWLVDTKRFHPPHAS
jgi:hypothetical protein